VLLEDQHETKTLSQLLLQNAKNKNKNENKNETKSPTKQTFSTPLEGSQCSLSQLYLKEIPYTIGH